MPTTYTPASDDLIQFVGAVWLDKFPDLWALELRPTLSILMAESEKKGQPALKHHGWPAAAIISITKPEERADGIADLRLRIDSAVWARKTEREREALIAHELFHVQVKTVPGTPDLPFVDDCGRPKIKLRPHDWEVGGFTRIVDLYGDDAGEKQIVDGINATLRQQVFPFAEGEAESSKLRRRAAAKG